MAQKITIESLQTPEQLQRTINKLQSQVAYLITAVNEINTWAETLAAKLNNDGGVTDADYDATITAGQISAELTKTL